MTVIRPNSISGITSITAQANEINIFRSDGTLAGLQINGINFNNTSGISTLAALNVTGNVSIAGTLTYEDVTNVDSIGIITARSGINVTSGRVLIGTTSATSLADELIVATSGDCGITIMSGTTHNGRLYFSDSGQEGDGFVDYDHQYGNLKLGTRDITRFTIDSDGRVLIGTGTVGETSADDLTIETSGNTGIAIRS